jgi:glucose/arabinose dehydrogenase
MKKLFFLFIFYFAFTLSLFSQAYTTTTLVTGLKYPVAFDFLPNGNFILTLKGTGTPAATGTAKIQIYSSTGTFISDFYDLSDSTNSNFERGLLGIEVDPNFSKNHYVYIYYNHKYAGDERFRVVRFTENANKGTKPKIIFDLDVAENIPGNHVGGNVRINPNDTTKMFISIGDLAYQQTNPPNQNHAQKLTDAYGKILRINKDGSIPKDNPFYDDGNPLVGNCDYIWSYGHRNPFDFAFSAANDSLYSSENGLTAWDECNVIHKGKNYGWNICEGFFANSSTSTPCTLTSSVAPITDFTETVSTPFGPPGVTGILHYSSNVFPTLTNHLLVAENDFGKIYDVTLGNAPIYDTYVSKVVWGDFVSTTGTAGTGLTTIMEGMDGCVYAMKGGYTTNGEIYRICPTGLYADELKSQDFFVGNPYPNPSNNKIDINLYLLKDGEVNVSITDITGKKIATILSERRHKGELRIQLDSEKIGMHSGSYLINATFGVNEGSQFTQTKKITIIK